MFFTVKIIKITDGTVSRDCRSFDSIDGATIRFHSDLSANIAKEGNTYVMCCILNELGGVYKSEYWYAPSEEPEQADDL